MTLAGANAVGAAIELPNDYEVVGFADAIDTLIWWETARPSARLIVDCNRGLRMPAHPAAIIPIVPDPPVSRPSPIAPAASRAGQPFLFGVAA